MARSKETKIELTAYDDLFETDQSREEAKLSKIRDIPISEIDEFPDHPFKVFIDEDMEQLVDSIKRNGVMTPATVRLKEDGRYELISGHRRKKACELAGLETLKCEVKDLSRDEAIIVMVESNLQRSTILPSEKAFAYKMRLEAMNRQGQRNDLTYSPMDNKLKGTTSAQRISEKSGDSQPQIYRYIRLTELVPEILQMVDDRQIAFRPAVEISYLPEEQQYTLLEAMEYSDATPSLAQANPFSAAWATEAVGTDDYLEAMQIFTDRVQAQIEVVKEEQSRFDFDMTPFTTEDCIPDNRNESIVGKVVVINAELNRYEYQHSAYQLVLVDGGHGAIGGRGQAVFGTCLADGKRARWERYDVLGVIKPEKMPDWAKEAVAKIKKQEKAKKPNNKEER